MTNEFYKRRIVEQFEYCFEVYTSDRSQERKLELVESAMGVVSNLINQANDIWVTITAAHQGVLLALKLRQNLILSKSHEIAGKHFLNDTASEIKFGNAK